MNNYMARKHETGGPEIKIHMELERLRYLVLNNIANANVDELRHVLEKYELTQLINDPVTDEKIPETLQALKDEESTADFKKDCRTPHYDEIWALISKYLKTVPMA